MTTSALLCSHFASLPGIREAYHCAISKKAAAAKFPDDSRYLIRYDGGKKCLVLQLKNNDLYYLFPVSKSAICVGGPSAEAGHRYPHFTAFKTLLEKTYNRPLFPLPNA